MCHVGLHRILIEEGIAIAQITEENFLTFKDLFRNIDKELKYTYYQNFYNESKYLLYIFKTSNETHLQMNNTLHASTGQIDINIAKNQNFISQKELR